MGNNNLTSFCTERTKQGFEASYAYSYEAVDSAYKNYKKSKDRKANAGIDRITDNSETAFLTMYEQNLALRNVHIDEWADRVKRFVYKKENTIQKAPMVKLK